MMAATLENEVVFAEADDDDGMPPLVDNPNPAMTFTFATDMSPITFSSDAAGYELPPESGVPEMSIYSPPASPALGPIRVSHAKKRDPSYIPRPPNAFILFRSSFIRAEHIPGKIEGNHSALSKIIGKYWKALPREEREVWEAKAIVAQAEHRMKYPDWRFRPSANALAKVKDGPKRRSRKGRGEAEKEVRSREKRCAKIADLLVAGTTGPALEAAVKAYDCAAEGDTKAEKVNIEAAVAAAPKEEAKDGGLPSDATEVVGRPPQFTLDDRPGRMPGSGTRAKTPDAAYDARFKIPLTSMFKRSSSAPASHFRYNSGQTDNLGRAETASGCAMPATPPMVYASPTSRDIASPAPEHEEATRVDSVTYPLNDGIDKTAPDGTAATQQSVPNFYGAGEFIPFGDSPQWHAASAASPAVTECWSPTLPSFTPDVDGAMSPAQPSSPVAFNISSPQVGNNAFDLPMFSGFGGYQHASFHSSYSSLNGWAGDAFMKGDQPLSLMAPPYVLPPSAGAGVMMKDTFEAATFVDWRGIVGASMVQDFSIYPPNNTRDLEGGQYYPAALQNIGCHPSNSPYVF
ncbi:uncharacterized protein B0H18DRAFT_669585 [Fomitopsis serialis]|uniref:uncharacterized protein n=1 Tax=Fomitopsis serialis TaxID=139415 RepID=UPI002008E573|nr:uncharacterized protein B0H18DRAFT_669585 [Neoantrodia serialis]KAH9932860.1 hypothetical protein B0H18DRAFT_669585 [Neoantrodia serialis]